MKKNRRLLKVMSLAMSLSSTILVTAWGVMKLADWGYISRSLGFVIFIMIIVSLFVTILYNASSKKDSL